MSGLLPTTAAALPVAAGWSAHVAWLLRRLRAAGRDPLTGLMRREGFQKAAGRLLRTSGPVAVVLIDLDGFKQLNDEFGHAAGDVALAMTGRRLADQVAACGIAARFGGDEFAAAVRIRRGPGFPVEFLSELHAALCRPLPVEGHTLPLSVGASLGAAGSDRHPAAGLSGLLRRADEAMYAAKRAGGGWRTAHPADAPQASVNGRRDGRRGTRHRPTDTKGDDA